MLDRVQDLDAGLAATEDAGRCRGPWRGFWQLQGTLEARMTLQRTLDSVTRRWQLQRTLTPTEDTGIYAAEDAGIYKRRWTL